VFGVVGLNVFLFIRAFTISSLTMSSKAFRLSILKKHMQLWDTHDRKFLLEIQREKNWQSIDDVRI
jgi:hypothetical protein